MAETKGADLVFMGPNHDGYQSNSTMVTTSVQVPNDISKEVKYAVNIPTVMNEEQPDPKHMPETAFVIAFCVKFNKALNIWFWPEDLDAALCSTEENPLIEKLHRLFLRNLLNLERLVERNKWMTLLSDIISQRLENNEDFYLDYNPLKRVNDNYYALGIRDKVMIMQCLVSWQLVSSNKIKDLIRQQHQGSNEDEIKPLEVEVLGEDTKQSKYYYLGVGARIYRETLIPDCDDPSLVNIKWEAVSTTIDDLKNFVGDRNEIDPSRSEKEDALYTKIVGQVIPYLEHLAMEKIHNDAEILPTRTRGRKSRPSSNSPASDVETEGNSNTVSFIVNNTEDKSNDPNIITIVNDLEQDPTNNNVGVDSNALPINDVPEKKRKNTRRTTENKNGTEKKVKTLGGNKARDAHGRFISKAALKARLKKASTKPTSKYKNEGIDEIVLGNPSANGNREEVAFNDDSTKLIHHSSVSDGMLHKNETTNTSETMISEHVELSRVDNGINGTRINLENVVGCFEDVHTNNLKNIHTSIQNQKEKATISDNKVIFFEAKSNVQTKSKGRGRNKKNPDDNTLHRNGSIKTNNKSRARKTKVGATSTTKNKTIKSILDANSEIFPDFSINNNDRPLSANPGSLYGPVHGFPDHSDFSKNTGSNGSDTFDSVKSTSISTSDGKFTSKSSKMALDNLLIHEPSSNNNSTLDVPPPEIPPVSVGDNSHIPIPSSAFREDGSYTSGGFGRFSMDNIDTIARMDSIPSPIEPSIVFTAVNTTRNPMIDNSCINIKPEDQLSTNPIQSHGKTSVASLLNSEEIIDNDETFVEKPSYDNQGVFTEYTPPVLRPRSGKTKTDSKKGPVVPRKSKKHYSYDTSQNESIRRPVDKIIDENDIEPRNLFVIENGDEIDNVNNYSSSSTNYKETVVNKNEIDINVYIDESNSLNTSNNVASSIDNTLNNNHRFTLDEMWYSAPVTRRQTKETSGPEPISNITKKSTKKQIEQPSVVNLNSNAAKKSVKRKETLQKQIRQPSVAKSISGTKKKGVKRKEIYRDQHKNKSNKRSKSTSQYSVRAKKIRETEGAMRNLTVPVIDKGKGKMVDNEDTYVSNGPRYFDSSSALVKVQTSLFIPTPSHNEKIKESLEHEFFEDLEVLGDPDSELTSCDELLEIIEQKRRVEKSRGDITEESEDDL
ncbi:13931_t:CDS:2 [Acaulospora colombiana]|uniref:13931_t:CDS:1 n=1 Tax=Acaulospora colombiana TaxID=27376 RepID=A0ACA9KAL2_9GLOM|nr:13931_t:CDS:2 [Acaulospora colombiana]